MTLRIHNTLTRATEVFTPIEPGHVRLYVCGITIYDHSHMGHARFMMAFDVAQRWLKAIGYRVTYVRNVTDIDDKIIRRALERNIGIRALTDEMIEALHVDAATLGMEPPTHEPRATEYVPQMLDMIATLERKGLGYRSSNGDVNFAVRKFPGYGKLSGKSLDQLRAGERVAVLDGKEDPLDFVMWKSAKPGEPEDAKWPSDYGPGRPGWHIECSAMAAKYLGEHFDIHCGGTDLIFPHHENEIAQSEAIYGPEFARMWIHGGFLNADNEKMSQSLGNFVTIKDVLARNDAEAFRYYLLGTKYGQQLSFELEKTGDGRVTFTGVDEAERRMDYLYTTRDALVSAAAGAEPALGNVLQGQAKVVEEAPIRVLAALDKDLNTPVAVSVIGELAKAANEIVLQIAKLKKDKAAWDSARQLAAKAVLSLDGCCAPLGLMQASSENYNARSLKRRLKIRGLDEPAINAKVQARIEARAAKDFARADIIRAELTAMGVELLDATGGATAWKIVA